MRFLKFFSCIIPFLFLTCQTENASIPEEISESLESVPEALPMTTLSLLDRDAFTSEGRNWQIAGEVYADLNQENHMEIKAGEGILVNAFSEEDKSNIITNFEHGDLDLSIDFLLPKGSNSGIYLQGRYEIQLLDSWGKENPTSGDCGGIYQRWDDSKPEGQKGYEGTPPKVNASKAPGLWQNFVIEFQAPRFDESGTKIKNAIIKKMYHNGYLIHDNIELTGPTRGASIAGEAATGPLFIQGDHGPVAFRNIKYKIYTQDKLSLSNISYEFFDGKDDKLPDFSKLTATKTGELDNINVQKASEQPDGYRLRFTGKLDVPVTGDYLFETRIDDGGELLIDGESIVFNEGDPGYGKERGLINLTKGTHDLVVTYYQEVWGAYLMIYYEGPGMIQQTLAAPISDEKAWKPRPPLLVKDLKEPEMIRSFINHKKEKKTNILSVGDPEGVHYSYDLRKPNLIKVWKGEFADVTKMWQGRGEPQLLQPYNFSLDLTDGVPIAILANDKTPWPDYVSDDYRFIGYEIDAGNRPIFKYQYGTVTFKDQSKPAVDGKSLTRIISKDGGDTNLYFRLAKGASIELLPNGLYSIDGAYYIKGQNLVIREGKELLTKMNDELIYDILW